MSETKPKTKGKKRRKIIKRIIIILVLLIVIAAAVFYFTIQMRARYTVTYDEYTSTTGTISNSLSFSGSLALRDSRTYTAPSAATVRNVYVTDGQDVKKGDKLVRLSSGTTVTADFDGRANVVSVKVDDEVAAGDTLVQIADFDHMEVSFRVDEYDINDVQVGDDISVTVTATEEKFDSAVEKINYISSSSGNVAYYTATAYLNVTGKVYPGMQVTVTIPQEEAADVVVLKADALSFTPANQAFVYKKKDDGTLEEVTVEIGVSNGNYVEIKSGLESGETVYAVSKTEENPMQQLFASMFGQQQFNRPSDRDRQQWQQNRENRQNGTGSGSSSGNSAPGGSGGGR